MCVFECIKSDKIKVRESWTVHPFSLVKVIFLVSDQILFLLVSVARNNQSIKVSGQRTKESSRELAKCQIVEDKQNIRSFNTQQGKKKSSDKTFVSEKYWE